MNKSNENRTRKVGDKFILRELSIYEKNLLEKKKLEQKENITKTQIVQGVEYNGKGFCCSEEIIEFKDFEVGKVYKKKLHLTNISLSFNSFKFSEIKNNSGHNFEIEYTPAGRISAGISVDFKIIFFPQTKKNAEIFLPLICETGKFEIPIVCTYKKTQVIVNQDILNFNSTIIGEQKIRKLKIQNIGGLKTNFEIRNMKGQNINTSLVSINSSYSVLSLNDEENADSIEFEKRVDNLFFANEMRIDYNKKLEGYSETEITFIYTPKKIQENWEVKIIIYFDNFLDQNEILVRLTGTSAELPITSIQDTYDLGICLFDSIYKEKIVFVNKSSKTSKVKIIAPMESQDFFHFNPSFTYIQPNSESVIWMKLVLTEKIKRYCEKYRKENCLVIPFKLNCSAQKIPVHFEIKLEFTNSILKYPKKLDFGSLYEKTSAVLDFEFSNQSALIQKIMFHKIPESISFEPNPIPIIVKPNSTLSFQVIYKSMKVIKEDGKILGKVIIGKEKTKEIEITYKAESIKCPLKFSALRLDFQTTQPKEYNVYILHIQNIMYKDYIIEIQAPPFEYSGLKISPLVKKFTKEMTAKFPIEYYSDFREIDYEFYQRMELNHNEFLTSSCKLVLELESEKEEIELEIKKKNNTKNEKLLQKLSYLNDTINDLNQKISNYKDEKLKNFNIEKLLEEKGAKVINISDNGIKYQMFKWLIPVFFKPLNETDTFISKLFIEVNTCVRSPSLICNVQELDFGSIPLGYKVIKQIELENKSDKVIDLKIEILPIYSGFQLLNVLTPLEKDKKKIYSISFEPEEAKDYIENVRFYSENSVNLVLKGKAEFPNIEIVDNKTYLDMGSCLINEYIEKSFELVNKTPFKLKFHIEQNIIGVDNQNDKDVFIFIPHKEYIEGNSKIEIKVLFYPKFKGEKYFSYIKINVDKQQKNQYLFIKASAFERQSYIKDFFSFDENFISEYIEQNKATNADMNSVELSANKNIILVFNKVKNNQENLTSESKKKKDLNQKHKENQISEAKNGEQNSDEVSNTQTIKITVGCCNLLDKKLEKPVDFEILLETSELNSLIVIDNMKGKINPGNTVDIGFSYTRIIVDNQEQISIIKDFDKFFFIKGVLRMSGGYFKEGGSVSVDYPLSLKVYRKVLSSELVVKNK